MPIDQGTVTSYLFSAAMASCLRPAIRGAALAVAREIDTLEGLDAEAFIYFIADITEEAVTVRRNTAFGKPWTTTFPLCYLWKSDWKADYIETHHPVKLESPAHEMEDCPRG